MVWGRGGERERETKKHVANEGKKPFSPVYKKTKKHAYFSILKIK
jgi:hypothetical protein